MKSGWLVFFKDRDPEIMTEKAYLNHKIDGHESVITAVGYLDIQEALERYPQYKLVRK